MKHLQEEPMLSGMQEDREAVAVRGPSRVGRTLWSAAVIAACFTTAAPAQEGWDFAVGAAVLGENVYVGSDDYYVLPMPSFKASCTKGRFSYVISLLEGLGVTYVNPDYRLLGSIAVNAGNERSRKDYSAAGFDVKHSDRTRRLLVESPNLSTPIAVSAMLGYLTPVGIVGTSVGYHPTTIKSARDGIGDEVGHGLLYSTLYMVELPISENLSFSGMFSLELMNQSYADAWYAVEHETEAINAFEANAGLRDAQIALQVTYSLSERVGISLLGADTILLQDARRSPYTVERSQLTMSLETFYRL